MTGKSSVDALSEGSSVIRWLMTEGRHITDAKSFLECFAARLRDARVDVSRITTGVPVLHPQLFSVRSRAMPHQEPIVWRPRIRVYRLPGAYRAI